MPKKGEPRVAILRDQFKRWHWQVRDHRDKLIASSSGAFTTLKQCLDDAAAQGYPVDTGAPKKAAGRKSPPPEF